MRNLIHFPAECTQQVWQRGASWNSRWDNRQFGSLSPQIEVKRRVCTRALCALKDKRLSNFKDKNSHTHTERNPIRMKKTLSAPGASYQREIVRIFEIQLVGVSVINPAPQILNALWQRNYARVKSAPQCPVPRCWKKWGLGRRSNSED